jgi:hypothetical protein
MVMIHVYERQSGSISFDLIWLKTQSEQESCLAKLCKQNANTNILLVDSGL